MALIEVFKSKRKPDTYLYLPKGCDQDTLPATLRKLFGEPQYVLGLDLQPDRQLARYSALEVLTAIEEQGFLLQLPDNEAASDNTAC